MDASIDDVVLGPSIASFSTGVEACGAVLLEVGDCVIR
jgi:hypothetical protein